MGECARESGGVCNRPWVGIAKEGTERGGTVSVTGVKTEVIYGVVTVSVIISGTCTCIVVGSVDWRVLCNGI